MCGHSMPGLLYDVTCTVSKCLQLVLVYLGRKHNTSTRRCSTAIQAQGVVKRQRWSEVGGRRGQRVQRASILRLLYARPTSKSTCNNTECNHANLRTHTHAHAYVCACVRACTRVRRTHALSVTMVTHGVQRSVFSRLIRIICIL